MGNPTSSEPPENDTEPGARTRHDPAAEALGTGSAYFDASAWNDLVCEPKRDVLVARLQARPAVGLASVISAGEILRTSDTLLRKELSSTMLSLHGDGPLLERPLDLARAAAIAHLRGDGDMLLPQSPPGRSLLTSLHAPDTADGSALGEWLGNSDANLERFLSATKPDKPNLTIRYYSPDVLGTEPFLRLLLTVPPAIELGLTLAQCRDLYERVDIWRALAATLGFIITESLSHSPRRKDGRMRPGGPDLWQAVYLGVAEVFVASDLRLLDAAIAISSAMRYPRCVVRTADFLDSLQAGPSATDSASCPVCRCSLPRRMAFTRGFHSYSGIQAKDCQALAPLYVHFPQSNLVLGG